MKPPTLAALALVCFASTAGATDTYTMVASWPAQGAQLVSDGTNLYTLDGATVTHYDANGAVLGSFPVETEASHPKIRFAGFDGGGNLYLSHFSGNIAGGSTVELYSPEGTLVASRSSDAWSIFAVDRSGFGYCVGEGDGSDDREILRISVAGESLGRIRFRPGGLIGLGISWDGYLFMNGYRDRYIWISMTGPDCVCELAIGGQDCCQGYRDVLGPATSDGHAGMVIYGTWCCSDSECPSAPAVYHFAEGIQGCGRDLALGQFGVSERPLDIATDSQGAVYLLTNSRKIEKWEPSSVTSAAKSSWGALKARWSLGSR